MARDRFIRGKIDREQLLAAVRAYGEPIYKIEVLPRDRWMLTLPGTFTRFNETRERWIEVLVDYEIVSVLTRDMDAITNDLADCLAFHIGSIFKLPVDP